MAARFVDEGSSKISGVACSDLKLPEKRSFRSLFIGGL